MSRNTDVFIEHDRLDKERISYLLSSKSCRNYCLKVVGDIKSKKHTVYDSLICDDFFLKENAMNANHLLRQMQRAIVLYAKDTTRSKARAIKIFRMMHLGDHFYLRLVEHLRRRNYLIIKKIDITGKEITRIKKEFVEHNVRLVRSVAAKYHRFGEHYDDLLQEGILGLLYAFERFDYRMECQFGTYAVWYIRQRILYGIQRIGNVRIPNYVFTQNNHAINRAKELVLDGAGSEEILKELAEKKMKYVSLMRADLVSLDAPLKSQAGGSESTVMDLMANLSVANTASEVDASEMFERINIVLKTLTPREEKLLRLRFGLVDLS